MMRLGLHEDHVAGRFTLPAGVHGLYLRRGALRVDGAVLAEAAAVLAPSGAVLEGAGEVWRFTVSATAEARATLVLSHALPRDPALPFVLRLDRVDFPPDAETPKHGHAGPGIRRLLAGRLLAELGDETRLIPPGGAWYESGAEPVVGRVLAPGTGFIRCMVLDAGLLGRPTFRAWTPEEALKPRGAAYRLFFDTLTTLEAP